MSTPKWTKELPKESGIYWWWDGGDDSLPYVVDIEYSGTDGSYFAPAGQHGWNRFQHVDEMEGWWMKLDYPELPIIEPFTYGDEVI